MKKGIFVFSGVVFCILLCNTCKIYAQEGESNANWKQELASGRQEIKGERQELKQDAQAALAEEDQLRQQIRNAVEAGDMKTADQLKAQLRKTHHENVQERQQDQKDIQSSRQELIQETQEMKKAHFEKMDRDNNPPGAKGGPGTNWENPPGAKGGPGASPDRKPKGDVGAGHQGHGAGGNRGMGRK